MQIQLPIFYKSKFFYLAIGTFTTLFLIWGFFNLRIMRARIINTQMILEQLEAQRLENWDKPNKTLKVTIQRGFKSDKGLDGRCFSWGAYQVLNGWTRGASDRDFYIDYYVPPGKPAIICTTPALAAALKAERNKGFIYEVYPVEEGLRVRLIVGVSFMRKFCRGLNQDRNCADGILERQAIVRHKPDD